MEINREYEQKFVRALPELFKERNHFMRTFGGELQIKDGVQDSESFMKVKTLDTNLVLNTYDTDENVGFGTGTANTSRFGERQEVKALQEDIKYNDTLAFDYGIDDITVNEDASKAVAQVLKAGAIKWVNHLNEIMAKALSDNASETLSGELTEDGVTQVFADARKALVNNDVDASLERVAYVNPDVYNILLKSGLTTTVKRSTTDIDAGVVRKFHGFVIEEVKESYFEDGEQILFAADNAGIVGLGYARTRTLEVQNHLGTVVQSAAKYAVYIPERNAKAILKAALTDGDVAEG